MCANFGDPKSPNRELRHKKKRKKRQFLGQKFIILLIAQKPIDLQS